MNRTRLQPLDAQAPGVVASLLRYWRSSLLIVLVAAVVVFGVSLVLPKKYQAKATIELIDPRDDAVFSPGAKLPEDLDRHTAQEISTIGSGSVLDRAAKTIGADGADAIKGDVKASEGSASGEIIITGRAGTADGAADLVNAVTKAYREVATKKASDRATADLAAIDKEAKALDANIAKLRAKTSRTAEEQIQLEIDEDSRREIAGKSLAIRVNNEALGSGVQFVNAARPPKQPVEPVPLRNAGVAALLALLAAGAVAWFRADRNRSADDSSTPASVLETPLLGGIPTLDRGADMAALQDGSSTASEAYQVITASLQHVFRWGVLLVTSAGRGDGKTVSAASIAGTAARDGTRVVLIDADVRAATLTARLIGASERRSVGLTDVAEGRVGLDDAVRFLRLSGDVTLPFLPAGSAVDDAGSLYRVAPMAQILQQLRETYDLVIVDCAAMLAVADAASLAVHADGILAVVSRGTPIATLDAVRQRLDLVDAPLVGYVFTRDDVSSQPYLAGPPVPAHIGGGRSGRKSSPPAVPGWQQAPPTNGQAISSQSENDDFWNRAEPANNSKSNGHAYQRPMWEVDLNATRQPPTGDATGQLPVTNRPPRRPGGPDPTR
jgi:Mrp family chromosome partitioning ATPase/capsular polysaccharide biosynthesis protein